VLLEWFFVYASLLKKEIAEKQGDVLFASFLFEWIAGLC